MKIIITENQLKLIKEAVGVPEGILNAAEQLYEIVSEELKSIDYIDNEYEFDITDKELQISDIIINHITLIVEVHEGEDYDGKPIIASMGVSNEFHFDNAILMQISPATKTLNLHINFVTSEEWKLEELLESFQEDETNTVSVMAHELKHKYDRTKKTKGFVGDTADYQTYASGKLNFGIPIINKFMRYSYFIQMAENLVRPTEISSRMLKKGITKEQFYEFITNDVAYKELLEIRNFSFDYLIENLYNEIDKVDRLLEYSGVDSDDLSDMEDETKIKEVLKLVYINLVNTKVDTFDNFFYSHSERMAQMFDELMAFKLFGSKIKPPSEEKEKVRRKFINHVAKYQNKEMDFFKDECERFNYVATKLIKKISKIYSLIPDEKEQTNESILNWDLHQKLMEKKYGKRKIDTKYKF
jgi:hypothetical protein